MTRRKPLPYSATQRIDDALMCLSEAERILRSKLLESKDVLIVAWSGRALDQVNQAKAALKEARQVEPE